LIRQNMTREQLPAELYHMERDPSELVNEAQRHPEVVQELEKLMTQARTPSTLFPLVPLDPSGAEKGKKKGVRNQ
jgi:hypothetical protein